MSEPTQVLSSSIIKFCVLVLLLLMDIALNSSLDHDNYKDFGLGNNVFILTLGIQIVVQLTVFLIVFLMAADTYLFRVGLLGLLLSQLKPFLICCPVYLLFTIIEGAERISYLSEGLSLAKMWSNSGFIALFAFHKTIAIPFYVLSLRATVLLCTPAMFHKAPWVKLVQAEIRKQNAWDVNM